MSLVEGRGLERAYRKGEELVPTLRGVDLDIAAGEFVALMGPSGSGKTTLLNLLAGIDSPTAGSLRIDGLALDTLSRSALADWRARHVGYVFQTFELVPILSAYENVELPLLLHAMPRRERHRRTALALDLVDLADRHDHLPRQLSGGQEQRVAIARAIVTDPSLVLADEPTGNLDSKAGRAILDMLTRLVDELGKTVVMVTHDASAAAVARRTLHLEDGRIVDQEVRR
jgi:putative ABC transport system ATP-binding protein